MSNDNTKIPTMHEEHRNWQSEYSMWHQDIETWQKQLALAADGLALIKRLAEQTRALEFHNQIIQAQEKQLAEHETDLARSEMFGLEYEQELTEKHLTMSKTIDWSGKTLASPFRCPTTTPSYLTSGICWNCTGMRKTTCDA